MGVAVEQLQQAGTSRERVVLAARHLFCTRGFHQTAMADLAEEAKVSVGAIYRSFKGKADIINAIVIEDTESRLREVTDLIEQVKAQEITIEVALTRLAMRQFAEKNEALSHEILAEAHRNPDVGGTISELCVAYRQIFRELAFLVNPTLTEPELDGAEELLLACMFGLGHRNLSLPKLSPEDTARMAACMIMHAFGSS